MASENTSGANPCGINMECINQVGSAILSWFEYGISSAFSIFPHVRSHDNRLEGNTDPEAGTETIAEMTSPNETANDATTENAQQRNGEVVLQMEDSRQEILSENRGEENLTTVLASQDITAQRTNEESDAHVVPTSATAPDAQSTEETQTHVKTIGYVAAVAFTVAGIGVEELYQVFRGNHAKHWTRRYIAIPLLTSMCGTFEGGMALFILSRIKRNFPNMKRIIKVLLCFTAGMTLLGTRMGLVYFLNLVF